jgi:hypothetical protein
MALFILWMVVSIFHDNIKDIFQGIVVIEANPGEQKTRERIQIKS